MSSNKIDLPLEEVEQLIVEMRGNIAAIARHYKVSRGTIWNRIMDSTKLQKALADSRETMIDNAESSLYSKVIGGDITAIIFFLKTQGKRRGYNESGESDRIIAAIYQELARLGLQNLSDVTRYAKGDSEPAGFVN